MNAVLKQRRRIGITLGVATTLVILGCSSDDSGLDRRYKVTGKVTYKGQPLPKAGITFEPANPQGRFANGYVEDGNFTLTTLTPGDGALPGDYKVIIVSSDLDTKALAEKTGGIFHQGDPEHQKAMRNAKSLIPKKYSKGETTDLKAKVQAGGSNNFDFDLKD
jgi:hypothetical protein